METLGNMARATMFTGRIPKREWPLVYAHANWLYNRLPHSKHALKKSPFEYVYNLKPDLTKVKVYGCEVFNYVGDKQTTGLGQKLNERATAFTYIQ